MERNGTFGTRDPSDPTDADADRRVTDAHLGGARTDVLRTSIAGTDPSQSTAHAASPTYDAGGGRTASASR